MRIGVPKEVQENECRVATTPEAIGQLQKLGFDIAVEAGAGLAAKYTDCLLYTSPSPRDQRGSRMPSSA